MTCRFLSLIVFSGICCMLSSCAGFHKQPVCADDPQQCIRQALDQAMAYANEDQFARAISVIDKTLGQFPGRRALENQRRQYEAMRRKIIIESQREILLARGKYLLSVRTSQEKLISAAGDQDSFNTRYKKFQKQVENTAALLFDQGRQAMENQEYGIAGRALAISNRLEPSNAARQMLSEIYRIQQEKRAVAIEQKKAEKADEGRQKKLMAEKQWSLLESDFREALENGNLSAARQLLSEMEDLKPKQSADCRNRLQSRIDREVDLLLSRGRFLYARGNIGHALEVWQQGLELKPGDPELEQNIRRAETFLQNLDKWGK